MQKSIKFTILIIVAILIYVVAAHTTLILNNNNLYYYIVNPLFWIFMLLFLKFALPDTYKSYKLRKEISYYTAIAILVYIITYSISGIFLTYGRNPFSRTILGIIMNIWILGTDIIIKEYVRYKLINNVYDNDRNKIAIIISIVYVISDFGLWKFATHNITFLYILKEFAQTIMPSIGRNILCSYISLNTTYLPAMAYAFITEFYFWVAPILPNSPWIMVAVIDTTIPIILFLYIRHLKYKKTLYKSRETLVSTNPRDIIPLVIVVILAIWFAIGIFPIKPIAIATGSMEKELMIGDVAIIQKTKADEIIVGDIIEYQKDDITVVHRVIKKYREDGELYFITKGDNNNTQDRDPVHSSQVTGKVILKIRYLGYPAIWLHLIQVEEQVDI